MTVVQVAAEVPQLVASLHISPLVPAPSFPTLKQEEKPFALQNAAQVCPVALLRRTVAPPDVGVGAVVDVGVAAEVGVFVATGGGVGKGGVVGVGPPPILLTRVAKLGGGSVVEDAVQCRPEPAMEAQTIHADPDPQAETS
jgi:hypothetical protein